MYTSELHRSGQVTETDGDATRNGDLDEDPEAFWTVNELAVFLRVSTKTVYGLIQEGKIPGVHRFRRSIRIYRPAVFQWAAATNGQPKRGRK